MYENNKLNAETRNKLWAEIGREIFQKKDYINLFSKVFIDERDDLMTSKDDLLIVIVISHVGSHLWIYVM